MTDIVSIGFKVDTSQIKQGSDRMAKMGDTAERAEKKTKKMTDTTSKGFALAKRNIAAAAAALAAYVTAGKLLDVAREFDILNASLVTATKSTENAAVAFKAIERFAATTPYNLSQSVDGFVKLVNLGLTPSEKALKSYGNTAAALGKDLSQMIEAVADATVGEFERLKEFGIKAKSEGDKVSFTFQGVTKTIGKNAAEIEQYLMAIGENEFAGAMAERAKTLDGAISNLGDSWDGLYRTISSSGVSSLIADGIRSITEMIDSASAYISSGALAAYANAFYEQWKWAFDGVAAIVNFVVDIFDASAGKIAEVYEFAFGKLPAYAKNAVQRIIIEISAIVDYAKIYGEAFVTMISLKFSEAADRAKVYGKDIANALNPFSDDYNADAELAKLDSQYATFYKNIMGYAQDRVTALKKEKEGSIALINAERDQSLSSFDAQIEKANELYEAFKKANDQPSSGDALEQFKLPDQKEIKSTVDSVKSIADEIDSLDINPFQSMTEGAQDALQAMSGMFESGSKDAKKLAIAMQALNLVQAVGAVLNQGSGDTYTAFGRMAAMAAMVASLGISIGNLSGGFADESAARQESQNLNSWGEHATSIADATEQTANATKKLVGINTDMLEALQNLTIALASASSIIAKNINIPTVRTSGLYKSNFLDNFGWKNFGDIFGDNFISKAFDFLSFDWLFKSIGSWLGGSSKVTDEGIRILGGSLSDLMDDVTIQAFQSIKYKKWRFGKTKSKTEFADLGDEVSNQFALVFESIADSVATGAEILGFSADDIGAALDAFVVKTTSLSLKGLSASKQAEVIENYFSSVFNDVAVAVVPFLRDFQQVGEELGTTLSRLATEASVAEYLVNNLGVTFADKFTDQEAFITAADNLATLAGGVETLADQVASFTDAFATDTQKLQIYQEAMKSALEEVGLSLPSSAAGFYELMSSLDATTEAGQQQIATLLGLTDTASAYYDLLDDTAGKFRDAAEALYDISYAAAQVSLDSALAAARLGDFSLAEALDLNSIGPSTSDFSSALEYNLARAETAAKLNELATLQEGSTTIDEKQLTVLEEIRDSLTSRDTIETSDSTNSQLVAQMAALKSEFKTLSNQITYGVLTVRQETTA
jgi:phage tail tape-measure protein